MKPVRRLVACGAAIARARTQLLLFVHGSEYL